MPLMSIITGTNELQGRGLDLLQFSTYQLSKQTFTDFEFVVADSSKNDDIAKYVEQVQKAGKVNVKYVKLESDYNISTNFNMAIKNSSGEIIKPLFQNDYIYNKKSLQSIADNFDKNNGWLCSSYMHTKDRLGLFKRQDPKWSNNIYFNNTIGALSAVSFLNNHDILFDENLKYFVDCEFYWRLYKQYNLPPKILEEISVIRTLINIQEDNPITQQVMDSEANYISAKHGVK